MLGCPPQKTPLVEFDAPLTLYLPTVRSPKSIALPVDPMVT